MMPDGTSNGVVDNGRSSGSILKFSQFTPYVLVTVLISILIAISFLGDGAAQKKVEFYGTTGGQVLIQLLFFMPIVILISRIKGSDFSFKTLILSLLALISFQILVLAYVPMFIKI